MATTVGDETATGRADGIGGSSAYSPAGEPVPTGWRRDRGQPDQLGDFVQQQPMTAALIALVVGYFIGKLT